MKSLIALCTLFILFHLSSTAQVTEDGILPSREAEEGTFTEWKKVESGDISFEYRIAFEKRKVLACYYTIEIKNNTEKKLDVRVKSHYFDKLVKQRFGDEYKAVIKPGKVAGYDVLTQGAKGDKEKKDQPDVERCLDCDFSYTITAEVD